MLDICEEYLQAWEKIGEKQKEKPMHPNLKAWLS